MRNKWQKFIGSERWDAVWLFIGTKVLVVVAAVPIVFAWKARTGGGTAGLLITGAVLYLIAFGLDALVKTSERRRKTTIAAELKKVRTDTMNAICNSFTGIPQHTTSFLTQVRAGDSETRTHLDRYFADIMEILTKTVVAREPRVCLYMVDSAESPKDAGEYSTTLLLCGNGVGRPDPPRSAFDSTTAYGKFVIQRMNDRRPVIVENTDDPPDDLREVLDCSEKYYKSFIAVPVTYNDHEYGMLMIDSPETHGLTKDHQAVANLFGRFLGSGFHMVQWSPASLPRLSVPRVSVESTGKGGG